MAHPTSGAALFSAGRRRPSLYSGFAFALGGPGRCGSPSGTESDDRPLTVRACRVTPRADKMLDTARTRRRAGPPRHLRCAVEPSRRPQRTFGGWRSLSPIVSAWAERDGGACSGALATASHAPLPPSRHSCRRGDPTPCPCAAIPHTEYDRVLHAAARWRCLGRDQAEAGGAPRRRRPVIAAARRTPTSRGLGTCSFRLEVATLAGVRRGAPDVDAASSVPIGSRASGAPRDVRHLASDSRSEARHFVCVYGPCRPGGRDALDAANENSKIPAFAAGLPSPITTRSSLSDAPRSAASWRFPGREQHPPCATHRADGRAVEQEARPAALRARSNLERLCPPSRDPFLYLAVIRLRSDSWSIDRLKAALARAEVA